MSLLRTCFGCCTDFDFDFESYFSVVQENDSGALDTVGAVVVDQEGNVAAAVSSGGLALKHPGRVGQVSRTRASGNSGPGSQGS